MADHYILVERDGPVAAVTLNRPDKLNALSWALMSELADELEALDSNEAIRCIVLTGAGDKAFAAGADIAEMSGKGAIDMVSPAGTEAWGRIRRLRTPLVGAVGGYALGGGNELAMHCAMIVASENARFGQRSPGICMRSRPWTATSWTPGWRRIPHSRVQRDCLLALLVACCKL